MKLLLVLMGILAAYAELTEEDCNGVTINGIYHEKEILHEGLDRPYLLTVEKSTNVLYFSYTVKNDEDSTKTARINLSTKEFADIKGVNNGFAQTVDPIRHEVYIGSSDGIYKYDYATDTANLIGEKGVNVWTIYFKDTLYYSLYPSQFLFTYSEGQATKFKDLEDTKVDAFVIDNDDVIFFTNATGLYSQPKGTKNATLYQEFPQSGVRGLAIDANGVVYACLSSGIYVVDKKAVTVQELVSIEDAFGLTFDGSNNLIYADDSHLVRLKPNKDSACSRNNTLANEV